METENILEWLDAQGIETPWVDDERGLRCGELQLEESEVDENPLFIRRHATSYELTRNGITLVVNIPE